MASTSSLGASASTNAAHAQQFYTHFNKKLSDLKRRIDESTSLDSLQQIGSELAHTRASLTDNTNVLPSYDRQVHEKSLKQVSDLHDAKRRLLGPKKGFAFQRKPNAAASPTSDQPPRHSSSMTSSQLAEKTTPPSNMVSSTFLSLSDRSREFLTASSLGGHNGQSDLHLVNLSYCTIDLRTAASSLILQAVQIRNLTRCIVQLGDVQGSVMIHDCTSCLFVLGCRQFRIHTSKKTFIAIHTSSIATMEHCQELKFTAVSASSLLPGSDKVEEDDPNKNLRVQDFDHINESEPSRSWSFADRKLNEADFYVAPTLPHPAGLELVFGH